MSHEYVYVLISIRHVARIRVRMQCSVAARLPWPMTCVTSRIHMCAMTEKNGVHTHDVTIQNLDHSHAVLKGGEDA